MKRGRSKFRFPEVSAIPPQIYKRHFLRVSKTKIILKSLTSYEIERVPIAVRKIIMQNRMYVDNNFIYLDFSIDFSLFFWNVNDLTLDLIQ